MGITLGQLSRVQGKKKTTNDFYIFWAPGRQRTGWGQVLLHAEVCVSGLASKASCSVANGAKLK